jgi:hypothetical protein
MDKNNDKKEEMCTHICELTETDTDSLNAIRLKELYDCDFKFFKRLYNHCMGIMHPIDVYRVSCLIPIYLSMNDQEREEIKF